MEPFLLPHAATPFAARTDEPIPPVIWVVLGCAMLLILVTAIQGSRHRREPEERQTERLRAELQPPSFGPAPEKVEVVCSQYRLPTSLLRQVAEEYGYTFRGKQGSRYGPKFVFERRHRKDTLQ